MTARHFLVIGAQRCGTTWLHDRLASHPEIVMARPARPEPKAFLADAPTDADDYRARFFSHAGTATLLGEKSTSYLESSSAPDRIAAILGDPQIVVQLRDPVARAVSNWSFSHYHGMETRPLADALRANLAGPLPWDPAASSVSPFAYLERGRYAADLAHWWGRFPVHVQFLEEQIAHPEGIEELLGWLGVAGDPRSETARGPVNASGPVDDDLDPELVTDLRAYFRHSDVALSEMLGRDLPWATRRQG